ncbi:MAG: VCBS repeat-containing protein [Verrucomicrobiales bacterium]|nr:VCBS repeat-containing protein [Verrucomicrobiales bacterium]
MRLLFTRNALIAPVAVSAATISLFVTGCSRSDPEEGEIVTEIEKPDVRPERADLGQFTKFKGQTISQILELIDSKPADPGVERSAAAALTRSLPDEPFPYSESAKPANEIALKQFVQTIEGGNLGDPSLVDLWRYNLASAALGKDAELIPEDLRLKTVPENHTENFPVKLVAKESGLVGPIAIGNFDGVEGLEIISHGGSKIWTISGDGTLVEMKPIEGTGQGSALYPADYDNDGDLDLFIARRAGAPNSLLQNDGKGEFKDVTIDSGLMAFSDTAAVAWTDYDQDGLHDIMIGNHDHPFEIFRQASVGKFEAVAWEIDMWFPFPVTGIEVADLNNDSYPDLLLSIDGTVNRLLYSIPSSETLSWRFLEKSQEYKLPMSGPAQTMTAFDMDNDGDLDVLIGNASGDAESRISAELNKRDYKVKNDLRLFINDGEGVLSDATAGSGLEGVEDVEAIHVLDLDNDGFEDVFVVTGDLAFNRAFWNRGGVVFREVSRGSRLNYLNSPTGIHSVDLDRDGSLDIFLTDADGKVKWLTPDGTPPNGWLNLSLENAVPGTRIKLLARDTDWILQPIHRVTGLNSQVLIGLGQIDKIEQIEIFPPQSIKPVKILKKVLPNQNLIISIPPNDSQNRESSSGSPS